MCSHYQAIKDAERLRRRFGIELPPDLGKYDVWPGYGAFFIRRPAEADSGDDAVPAREAVPGLFGLVPHWAKDLTVGRRTYNARSGSGRAARDPAWAVLARQIRPGLQAIGESEAGRSRAVVLHQCRGRRPGY